MKKLLVILLVVGMLISAGCEKQIKPLEQTKIKAPTPIKKISVVIGMTLQRFLLSEEGKSARLQFHNDTAQIKQQLWVYDDGTVYEDGTVKGQCFLFHDEILVDWQN